MVDGAKSLKETIHHDVSRNRLANMKYKLGLESRNMLWSMIKLDLGITVTSIFDTEIIMGE
jgi:hypothetical protein